MRNVSILLVTMRALANEVAKNLVLAGIGSLTVLDPDDVVEDDLGSQFFISDPHVGQNVGFDLNTFHMA
jgi:ubiquitin-like 1-activating enzyme E1 A